MLVWTSQTFTGVDFRSSIERGRGERKKKEKEMFRIERGEVVVRGMWQTKGWQGNLSYRVDGQRVVDERTTRDNTHVLGRLF